MRTLYIICLLYTSQYRGWFQSSLLIRVANYGDAPYKTVLTHGMVIDLEGRKMSKSMGNGIDPLDVIQKNGADILRMWVASSDFQSDIRISNDIISQLSEGYRKIRNTARYLIGNLSDYCPDHDSLSYQELLELDRWALMRLNQLVKKAQAAYENFEYHVVYHAIHQFCVVDMSSFYLDIIKDRLYTEKSDSAARRSAQTAMYQILSSIVRLMSPIIAFTAEEIDVYKRQVVDNSQWYLAVVCEQKQALNLTEGKRVNVRFPDEGNLDVACRITKISDPQDGKVALFLTGTRELYHLYNSRKVHAEIIFAEYSGLQVPANALRKEEGKDVVRVLGSGSASTPKEVEVLYQNQQIAIIKEDNTKKDSLLLYEEVLLQ